jgi:hypothetical protein
VAIAKAAKVAKRIAEAEVAKLVLGDGCERLARRALLATELPDKIEGARLRDLAWTTAVMIDKMRLLREQPLRLRGPSSRWLMPWPGLQRPLSRWPLRLVGRSASTKPADRSGLFS